MRVPTVVVGVDGSDNAHRALETAIELVAEGGELHLVGAYHAPSARDTADLLKSLPPEFRDTYDPLAAPRANLEQAEAIATAQGVTVQRHFVQDHPAAAILDVADEVQADLIVVGSRGLGRGTRFLRGSVSSRVASHANTSFLVVHES